jgi:hypothetical protein
MMPRSTNQLRPLSLNDPWTGNQLRVDLESFFEFSFWISEQLEQMVSRERPANALPAKERGSKRPGPCSRSLVESDN